MEDIKISYTVVVEEEKLWEVANEPEYWRGMRVAHPLHGNVCRPSLRSEKLLDWSSLVAFARSCRTSYIRIWSVD